MADPVFVVIRTDGEYSDRLETVIGYFTDEERAKEFCVGAEREWRDAAAKYPEPAYPQGMALMHNDYDLVWPQKEVCTRQESFGTVTIVTPDYSANPTKVLVPDEEHARRVAVRAAYHKACSECRANREAAVTFDKEGRPDSSWYYEAASPIEIRE